MINIRATITNCNHKPTKDLINVGLLLSFQLFLQTE